MPQNTDHYAIAIGIDDYSSLRRMRSCVKDATRMSEWFASSNGGNLPEKPNVRLITSPGSLPDDPFDAKPIQLEIDRALRDFGVERGQRIGKRLYFYFAGHGFGPKFDEVGMLMANATMGSLNANIGLQTYRLYFQTTRLFDEVIFLLDCCRDPEKSGSTQRPIFNGDAVAAGAAAAVTDFIVLAAPFGAKAFAPVEVPGADPRGLLTNALLEGLNGDTRAIDSQGRITAASLRQYLLERVKTLAGLAQLQQDPDVPGLPNPEIVFRTIDPNILPRVSVNIVIPPEYTTGEIVLSDANDREIERRAAPFAPPWTIDLLKNSRYQLRHILNDYSVVFDPGKSGQNPYVFNFPRPAVQ